MSFRRHVFQVTDESKAPSRGVTAVWTPGKFRLPLPTRSGARLCCTQSSDLLRISLQETGKSHPRRVKIPNPPNLVRIQFCVSISRAVETNSSNLSGLSLHLSIIFPVAYSLVETNL
jgi:hypothetical protein